MRKVGDTPCGREGRSPLGIKTKGCCRIACITGDDGATDNAGSTIKVECPLRIGLAGDFHPHAF